MKKIIICCLAVIVLFLGLCLYLFFNINTIIANNSADIEGTLSKAIGAPVQLGKIEASFMPLGVKVNDVTMGKDKTSNKLNHLFVSLKLLPLLSKTADITKVEIFSPKITLIKDKHGIYPAGFPAPKKKHKRKPQQINKQKKEASSNEDNSIEIKLNSLTIKDGKFILKDTLNNKKTILQGIKLTTKATLKDKILNLSKGTLSTEANNTSLSLDFKNLNFNQISSNLKVDNIKLETPAGSLNSKIKLNKDSSGEIEITKSHFDLDVLTKTLQKFDIDIPNISGTFSSILHIELVKDSSPLLNGSLVLNDAATKINDLNINDLTTVLSLQNDQKQFLSTEPLKFKINNFPIYVNAKSTFVNNKFTLENITAQLFSGSLSGLGEYDLKNKNFSSNLNLDDINITEVLQAFTPQVAEQLSGILNNFKLHIQGTVESNTLNTLSGDATLLIKNGELTQVNIAKDSLAAISNIISISNTIQGKASPKLQQLMNKKGTTIKDLKLALKIEGHKIKINKLSLLSDFFNLDGTGVYNIGGSYKFDTTIYFSPDVSSLLISSVKELKSALDNKGQLSIPLIIKGDNEGASFLPDTSKLLVQGSKAAAKEGLKKLLDKSNKTRGLGNIINGLW